MKHIFVLEDDPQRIMWFEQRFFDHVVTYADSVSQVDRFVGPYDLVCLDHDLGGRQLEAHEDSGEAFARAIQDNVGDAAILIHSYNPEGAKNMAALLPQAIEAPFRSTTFNVLLPRFLGECQN